MKSKLRSFLFAIFFFPVFSIQAQAQTLCSATDAPTSTHGCTYEYFSRISATGTGVTSTIDISGITSCTGYYFPDTSGIFSMSITASPGDVVNLNLTRLYDPGYTAYVTVWVDWNNNGFYEAAELSGTSMTWPAGSALGDSIMVYPFTVPLTATIGSRVHMRLFLYDNSASPPCTMEYGSAYDFWFIVGCLPPPVVVTPTSGSICRGGTGTMLTASGAGAGGTYTWTPAAGLSATTGASVRANPTTTTTYTVTGTNATGCFAKSESTVTVNAPPSPISGTELICPGATTALSDGAGSGTWLSNTPAVATISSGGTATGVAAGTSVITFTLSSTGCYTTSVLTVQPNPAAISGALHACPGTTTTLTDATSGGTWISTNTSVATVGSISGIASGIVAGTSMITYTAPTGCSTETTLTVNPLPAGITGASQACAGFETNFADASSGGRWSSSNPAVVAPTFLGGLFYAESAGTATITYTLATGCYATASFTVNAGPAAITGARKICTGLTTALGDTTSGGTWSSSDIAVATVGTSGVVNGAAAGTAVITYSPGSGCPAVVTVTVYPVPSAIAGPGSVCAASEITLSNAVPGGAWSSPGFTSIAVVGSSTGIVSGVSAGTAIITYSIAAGCSVSTMITVNPLPAVITGPNHLCPGQVATVADTSEFGSWSSSGSALSVNPSTGNVSALAAGTSVISYSLPTGCLSVFPFTVDPLPGTIAGASSVCAGAAAPASDPSTGGTWSDAGYAAIAGIGPTTGIVTGITAGTLIVTYTLPTGCMTSSPFTVEPLPSAITGETHVCQGASTTLADPTSGGLWSASATATVGSGTGIVAGVYSGTAIITYTAPNGCFVTTSVTIYPMPANIHGAPNVCIGYSITLTDSTEGGTWSTAETGIGDIDTLSGVLFGNAVGTATITYTASTGCLATTTEIVNPLPGPIEGPTAVCQYFTTLLSDAVPGGTWHSGSSIAAIGSSSGVVTGVTAGTALVTYFLGTGCTTSVVVTVNPAPAAITGSGQVCIGSTTNLYSATAGGSWSDAGSAVVATIDAASGLVNSVSVGSAIVTYGITATGCFTTATVDVNPLPGPITGTTLVCQRAETVLADRTTGGSWTSDPTSIATVDPVTGTVTGIRSGTAIITYTSALNCASATTVHVILAPALISGDTSICTGSTAVFSDSTSEGVWSSGATTMASIDSAGTLTALAGGAVVITYTINTGCYSTFAVAVDQFPTAISGLAGFCADSTTALTDSVTGGKWTSSAISIATIDSTGVLSGVSSGTAMITYSTGPGCNAIVTVTVMPLIAPITGADSLCSGTSVQLSDLTPGGAWRSSNTGIATVDSSGIVSGIISGVTLISYSALNVCGIGILTLTVNPQPKGGIISGTSSICTGTPYAMNESVPSGLWSVSGTGTANITASGVLTGIAAGTDTVYYSVTNSCGTAVAKFAITINQTPDSVRITTHPDPYICSNTQFQNFGTVAPQAAGTVYSWSTVNAAIYAISPDHQYCLVNFNEAGTSWVILSVGSPGTGCFESDSMVFHVSTLQSPAPVVVYYAPELICHDNTAESYQWGYDDAATLDSTVIPNAVNENYYLANPDFLNKYYWVITNHGGCLQKSYYNAPEQVGSATLVGQAKFTVYPNPATDAVNIEVPGNGNSDNTDVRIDNMLGEHVLKGQFIGKKGTLSLADLPSGTYLLFLINNGEQTGATTIIKN